MGGGVTDVIKPDGAAVETVVDPMGADPSGRVPVTACPKPVAIAPPTVEGAAVAPGADCADGLPDDAEFVAAAWADAGAPPPLDAM